MKNLAILLLSVFVLLNVACTGGSSADQGEAQKVNTEANPPKTKDNTKPSPSLANQEKGAVKWINWSELEDNAKKEPRKVVVDLYTSWCGWCKRMDKATFQHPEVAKYLNEKFYAVKFNAETKTDIDFNGGNYKFIPRGRRGTNELALKLMLGDKKTGRTGYPTIAFLDENLQRIDAYPGYKSPDQFDAIAKFIEEDHYKDKSLAQFQKTYTSSIPAPAKPAGARKVNVQGGQKQPINIQQVKKGQTLQLKKPANMKTRDNS